jgi:surface antigen
VVNGESGISKEEIASNPEVGDVIVTNDGEYGHVAVISKILNNNSVELVESNWKDDEKIGAGRVLALNSPSIEGGWRKG